ncbi:MAG: Rieske (2Fe-2S) protein [Streptosporangiaceae bacterium]
MNDGRASKIFRSERVRRAQPVEVADRLAANARLDGPIQALSSAIRRAVPAGPLRNLLHGVPIGHPLHAPLTDVPIGAWTSVALLDLIPGTRRASQILIAAGLAAAVPTALTGLADWSSLHREQQRVGLVHALGTGTATALYTVSLLARRQGRDVEGKLLGFAGLTALLAGGYLGGHLAFRQAAGANHAESIAHLVPLGWHDLGSLEDLPNGWPVARMLGYISLFVLRIDNAVYVLTDRCAHLAGPLHQGRVVEIDSRVCVVCPWHGSTFRVADGSVAEGPATGSQPAFDTRILEDGTVQVRPV